MSNMTVDALPRVDISVQDLLGQLRRDLPAVEGQNLAYDIGASGIVPDEEEVPACKLSVVAAADATRLLQVAQTAAWLTLRRETATIELIQSKWDSLRELLGLPSLTAQSDDG